MIRDCSRLLRRKAGELLARVGAAVASEIGREEVYLYGALALIAYGFWDLWRPGTFLAPGVVLLWVSLPMRAGFVERSTEPQKAAKKG